MALTWATPADVTDRWIGAAVPATEAQLRVPLEDVEDLILRDFPDLPSRIGEDPGQNPLGRVKRVASRVAIRHLKNPEGVRSSSEGAGPFQRQTTFGGDEPGALFLSDEDRADLGGTKSRRAFQVDMTPSAHDARGAGYRFTHGVD